MTGKERIICQKIYEDYHQKINWYIWKHCGWLCEEKVHDVMQELWIALCQNITEISERTEGEQWAWLVTVVRNSAITELRKMQRDKDRLDRIQAEIELYPKVISMESNVMNKMAANEILKKLSPEEKRILFEEHLDEESSEGKKVSKRKSNAVVCKTYRARKKLEKYMKDGGLDE